VLYYTIQQLTWLHTIFGAHEEELGCISINISFNMCMYMFIAEYNAVLFLHWCCFVDDIFKHRQAERRAIAEMQQDSQKDVSW